MNFQWVMLAKCMGWEVLGPPYGAPKHRKALGKRPAGVADMDVRDQTPRQEVAWVRRGPQSRGCAGGFAPSGVSFLLVTFLWTSKEKSPWVRGGSIPHSYKRRPQGGSTM